MNDPIESKPSTTTTEERPTIPPQGPASQGPSAISMNLSRLPSPADLTALPELPPSLRNPLPTAAVSVGPSPSSASVPVPAPIPAPKISVDLPKPSASVSYEPIKMSPPPHVKSDAAPLHQTKVAGTASTTSTASQRGPGAFGRLLNLLFEPSKKKGAIAAVVSTMILGALGVQVVLYDHQETKSSQGKELALKGFAAKLTPKLSAESSDEITQDNPNASQPEANEEATPPSAPSTASNETASTLMPQIHTMQMPAAGTTSSASPGLARPELADLPPPPALLAPVEVASDMVTIPKPSPAVVPASYEEAVVAAPAPAVALPMAESASANLPQVAPVQVQPITVPGANLPEVPTVTPITLPTVQMPSPVALPTVPTPNPASATPDVPEIKMPSVDLPKPSLPEPDFKLPPTVSSEPDRVIPPSNLQPLIRPAQAEAPQEKSQPPVQNLPEANVPQVNPVPAAPVVSPSLPEANFPAVIPSPVSAPSENLGGFNLPAPTVQPVAPQSAPAVPVVASPNPPEPNTLTLPTMPAANPAANPGESASTATLEAPVLRQPSFPHQGETKAAPLPVQPRVDGDPRFATTENVRTNYDVDIHTVERGDSYTELSRKYYYSEKYADALRAYNRNQILTPGQEIEIPNTNVLRKILGDTNLPSSRVEAPLATVPDGSSPRVEDRSPAPPVNDVWRATPGAVVPLPKYYTVPRDGMTFWEVAQVTTGSRENAHLLRELNPKIDANIRFKKGDQVRLPENSRASQSGSNYPRSTR